MIRFANLGLKACSLQLVQRIRTDATRHDIWVPNKTHDSKPYVVVHLSICYSSDICAHATVHGLPMLPLITSR